MKYRKYALMMTLLAMAGVMSCTDESLYPLPYTSQTFGSYLRMYRISSNILDLNDMANSGFEVVYESVDGNKGRDIQSVDFFVSLRRGTVLTNEAPIKSVPADGLFSAVPEPTYSEYLRGTIRITADETLTALRTLTTDPDGNPCANCTPLIGLQAFPGGAGGTLAAGDQIIYRWEMVTKDGRKLSVANPQTTVSPSFANNATANNTPNVTGGQFYSSPFIFTALVRPVVTDCWLGTYTLQQTEIWSTNHTPAFHINMPSYLNTVLFPTQTVTLEKVPGGLSSERQFTIANYRGSSVTMRINFEPAPTTAAPTAGTVYVPQQNTGVTCTGERQIYWGFPASGNYTIDGTTYPAGFVIPAGLPQATTALRGAFNNSILGTTAGDSFTIGLTDDDDEYARNQGYCTWTRTVKLKLTKL